MAIPANADPPKHILPGESALINGERRQCYDLEGYKGLLKADVDLDSCLEKEKKYKEQRILDLQQIKDLNAVLEIQKESVALLKEENEKLFEKWALENKKRHEAENQPALGSYLAWATAGVFVVTTAVLATVIVID